MPYYLSIGVSKQEFLESNPQELEPYVRANEIIERRKDNDNYLLGIYMQRAIASCLNGKDVKYFDKPILSDHFDNLHLTQEEKDAREIKKMLEIERMWIENAQLQGLPTNN